MSFTTMDKQGRQNWIIFTSIILHMYIQQVHMMDSGCTADGELNRKIADFTKVHTTALQRDIEEEMDRFCSRGIDPCLSYPCLNGGSCVSYNETDEDPRYECVCPSTPCSCADQGTNCEYSEDDCGNGAEASSFHFNRTDPECRSYYRCHSDGSKSTSDVCPEGKMVDAAREACISNRLFECYVEQCRTFIFLEDWASVGAKLVLLATTVDACKAACLEYDTCIAVDWIHDEAPHKQCWLFQEGDEAKIVARRRRPCLDQYILQRNC